MLAAEAGVGAPVLARVESPEALLVQFVEGVTLAPRDFQNPRRVSALADALKRLQAAPPFARDFDMAQVQNR